MTNGRAKKGDVLVLVGTSKGAFILSSDPGRGRWSLSGPHFAGADVFHVAYDFRGEGTVVAAVNHPVWGADIQRSRDMGRTWEPSKTGPKFKAKGQRVNRVWHVEPGRAGEPGMVYAGVEAAALFRSRNGGDDWEALTRGLPQRNAYLHSMREGMATDSLDPCGVYVGTTTGQVFHSRDDGDTWSTLIDNLPPILSVSSGRVV